MKKHIIAFILFSAMVTIYWLYHSKNQKHFVYLKEGKFFLNNEVFYPVALNYIVSLQADTKNIWACPYIGYNSDFKHPYSNKDSCLKQLKANMVLIREMGFNTVRLVGIGEENILDKKKGLLSVSARMDNSRDTAILFSNPANYQKYFDALDELFEIASSSGLKVIFLLRVFHEIPATEEHLKKVVHYFRKDTSIMAYDLFNEPLYFDSLERNKEDVFKITKSWKKIMQKYAPDHLSTIGMSGIREIFEWDPNLLQVDFLSFHPYEYEPEQVRNEMYWYGKHVSLPWMIGETSIPADGDSVSYETQQVFAHNTLKQAYNCGSIGYSWWQYKDVEWHKFHANFMGVLNQKGQTETASGKMPVSGTPKPVVSEFKKFDGTVKKDSCRCFDNYYNYSMHKDCRITGRLMDEKNTPIEGGVILAWNQWWTSSYHTVTKKDGSFELLGSFPFYHWMASAPLHSRVHAAILPDTARAGEGGIPTINLGTITIGKLSLK